MNQRYDEAATLFRALAHPARLRILAALRDGEACVCHLEEILAKPQAYMSQQLAVLRAAGLVRDRKEGQWVYYTLADERLLPLLDATLGDALGETPVPGQLDACRCRQCQVVLQVSPAEA
jgi:ArsR family transcriptional regulator